MLEGLVGTDPTNDGLIHPGGVQRRGNVGQLDSRRPGLQLGGPLGADRPVEVGVDNQ